MGNKETKASKNTNTIFQTYSNGITTGRDVWVYNSSKEILSKNMKTHIDYCNNQDLSNPTFDTKQGKWTEELTDKLKKMKPKFNTNNIRIALYRPFFKQYLYLDKTFNARISFIPKSFPNKDSKNLVIIIPSNFTGKFTTFITNVIPDLHIIAANQCFPLYIYANSTSVGGGVSIRVLIISLILHSMNIENIIIIRK